MSAVTRPATPALALTIEEACNALSVSWDTFNAHIADELRIVRVGRRKLVPVSELQRWLDKHAESTIGGRS